MHEEQWLSFLCILYPMVQLFFVELGFFIAKTLLIWERSTTSCMLEWLITEGSSNLFLLHNKAFLAYLYIISQACFPLLPYLLFHYTVLYFAFQWILLKFHCIYCFKWLKSRVFFILKCRFKLDDFRNDKKICQKTSCVAYVNKSFLIIEKKIFVLILNSEIREKLHLFILHK